MFFLNNRQLIITMRRKHRRKFKTSPLITTLHRRNIAMWYSRVQGLVAATASTSCQGGRHEQTYGDYFDIYIAVLKTLARTQQVDESINDATSHTQLVFYDNNGKRVNNPPIETTTNSIDIEEKLSNERYLALLLRRLFVAENLRVKRRVVYDEAIYRIIASQGYLFDPIGIAYLKQKEYKTIKGSVVIGLAVGLSTDTPRLIDQAVYLTQVMYSDHTAIITNIIVSTIIHNLLYNKYSTTGEIANVIDTAFECGMSIADNPKTTNRLNIIKMMYNYDISIDVDSSYISLQVMCVVFYKIICGFMNNEFGDHVGIITSMDKCIDFVTVLNIDVEPHCMIIGSVYGALFGDKFTHKCKLDNFLPVKSLVANYLSNAKMPGIIV